MQSTQCTGTSKTLKATVISNNNVLCLKKFWKGSCHIPIYVPSFEALCEGCSCLECSFCVQCCLLRARGKIIGLVVVVISTKIARSQKLGVWQSALCHQIVEIHEKLCSVCFKLLRKAHKHYKSCIFTGHTYRPHLPMPCAVFIAHAQSQNR